MPLADVLLPAALCLVTFAAAAVGDVVEAYFVRAVADGHAHRAARMSVGMYVVSFSAWIITVRISLWYAVPEIFGLYLGSLVAVRRQQRAPRHQAVEHVPEARARA